MKEAGSQVVRNHSMNVEENTEESDQEDYPISVVRSKDPLSKMLHPDSSCFINQNSEENSID